MGKFIWFAWGLTYEGAILAYDPMTYGAEWVLVHDTVQDLLRAEEVLVFTFAPLFYTAWMHSQRDWTGLRRIGMQVTHAVKVAVGITAMRMGMRMSHILRNPEETTCESDSGG